MRSSTASPAIDVYEHVVRTDYRIILTSQLTYEESFPRAGAKIGDNSYHFKCTFAKTKCSDYLTVLQRGDLVVPETCSTYRPAIPKVENVIELAWRGRVRSLKRTA